MVDKNADVVLKEITNIIRSSTFLYYISINYIRSVKDDLVSLGFTSDLWTSRSLDSYISLTVSIIDRFPARYF